MKIHNAQRGVTMIEATGALLIAATMLAGLTVLIDNALEDSKGQQASLYQAQVVEATKKYLNDFTNYNAQVNSPTGITVNTLKTGGYLPSNFSDLNAYGQKTCVLPKPKTGKLDVLIVTTEGSVIGDKDIPAVAANAGVGNGYIVASTSTGATGSSWSLTPAELASFTASMCPTYSVPTKGHLASALFFDSAGQLSTDFLYRNKVAGRPELNQMKTPLFLPGTAIANSTESGKCHPADPTTYGAISTDSNGQVLSCISGTWRNQEGRYWRAPIDTYANLTSLPAADNNSGDVRMVTSLSRAFTWDSVTSSWLGLGVDQNGNLTLTGTLTANNIIANDSITATNSVTTKTITVNSINLNLNQATAGATCTKDGSLSSDANGQALSCVSGIWRDPTQYQLGNMVLNFTPTDTSGGTVVPDIPIDLTALSGKRPLYLSGDAICISSSSTRAYVAVLLYDAFNRQLGWSGVCASASMTGSSSNQIKVGFGIQKIPNNATTLVIRREPGANPSDLTHTLVEIYESQ